VQSGMSPHGFMGSTATVNGQLQWPQRQRQASAGAPVNISSNELYRVNTDLYRATHATGSLTNVPSTSTYALAGSTIPSSIPHMDQAQAFRERAHGFHDLSGGSGQIPHSFSTQQF